jgi:uncharacterized cupin superfamily protein
MTATKTAAPARSAFDPKALEPRIGSGYPDPFHKTAKDREKRALGDVAGLTQFGVNLVRLPPGAWSAQRHWHSDEDELVYVLEGELMLVTDAGEEPVKAGMAAGFPRGKPNGHHFINRSDKTAIYLEVGTRSDADVCRYPDIDLHLVLENDEPIWLHKDGRRY